MKHLLLTTIVAVVLVGCGGPSVDIHEAGICQSSKGMRNTEIIEYFIWLPYKVMLEYVLPYNGSEKENKVGT